MPNMLSSWNKVIIIIIIILEVITCFITLQQVQVKDVGR